MIDLLYNMYIQAVILSFFSVCIIKWIIIPIIEGIINGIDVTKSKKRIFFLKKYIYFLIPGTISIFLAHFRPVDTNFFLNLFIYFGIQTFIFKSAFKVIVNNIEDRIKRRR